MKKAVSDPEKKADANKRTIRMQQGIKLWYANAIMLKRNSQEALWVS